MKFGSAVAIYFITWWVCLFIVLPFGVKNAHEAGETARQPAEGRVGEVGFGALA